MHPPIFVRELSGAERAQLDVGLRSPSAFTVRRAQIVRLSAAGRPPRAIAQGLCCAVQTVRNAIRAFNARGLAALDRRFSAAQERRRGAGWSQAGAAARSPAPVATRLRPARSTWKLTLLAQVAHDQGLSATVLSDETIRRALARLEVGWKRAKRWLTSPDPDYARKKVAATA